MEEKVWVQCQLCGELYRIESEDIDFNSDDDCCIYIYCPGCRDETKHLEIGKYADEVYIYGNLNLDGRYYKYNTK